KGFEELLASRNIPWVLRKMILLATETIKFTNLGDARWETEHQMLTNKAKYAFCLGEEFITRGMDGFDHKV
ncbi:hypothetical protein PFISCL1PPCAC_18137, partial [Pristionchus fissidentatus]